MAVSLNEPAIRALHARLVDELPAAIAGLNAEVSDGFELDELVPDRVLDFVPPIALLVDFPTIGIGDGRTTFEDDTGNSATGKHELLIVAYLQNADQRMLAWQLRRTAQVLVRVALRGRNLGDGGWGTGLVSIDPGPTLTDNPDAPREFASWVGVRMWVKNEQE